MKKLIVLICLVTLATGLVMAIGCGEAEKQKEAADEMGREAVEEVREALEMFYELREFEKDPTANAAQIESLEAEIIEKWPWYGRTVDANGKMGLGPTEEHIEWIEGLLEETKYK